MIEHIKKLFIAMIAISCFTCFQRADYNLPMFAFAFFLWDYKRPNSQKERLFYLFCFTWIVDFVWLIYWGVTWSSEQYKSGSSSGTSTFVMSLSIVSFIVKFATIALLFLNEPECKLAIKNILQNIRGLFSGERNSSEYAL